MNAIQLNLPKTVHWESKPARFKQDSTQRIQAWFKKDKQGEKAIAIIIYSQDKNIMSTDFKGTQQAAINDLKYGEKVSLITEKQLENKYPFALYRVILKKKEKGKPGSYLMAILETENSIHTIFARQKDIELSNQFIETWSTILEHPSIQMAKNEALTKTQITLHSSEKNALQNEVVQKQLLKRIQGRFGNHFLIKPKKFSPKEGKIILELIGNYTPDSIRENLTKANSFQLLPLYRGKKYASFQKKVTKLLAAEGKEIQAKTDSRLAYFARLPKESNLLTEIQQLVAKQNFAKGIKLQTGPEMGSNAILLYLIDSRKEVVDQTHILKVAATFNYRQYPSVQITFDRQGTENIARWTQNNAPQYLAFSINDKIWSAPFVNQTIPGGRLEITGGFTVADTEKIKDLLNDTYPIPIRVEEVRVIKN
ncbi:SecDF P1 head subdomain-containing protein [Zunongwangia sp. HGR-M22]|uniref:SecDF P1 head subdomain-containing protein n=1 Tax=Zunongwangia sp. HGR-M22 TaxID=3015168 RepID=UPI0022DCF2A9|nr:hypothetical protein [Zunongwangia sp. HGR-M22]WBL27010.1 hypothetical protein PBT91_07000 [Zunongwangia sp. HGR-M22]